MGMTRKTGELRIFNGQPNQWASLFFKEEELLHAQKGSCEGIDAFLRIIANDNSHFHFFNDHQPEKTTINKPVHYLMLQVHNMLDEMNHIDKQLPATDSVLFISKLVDPVPRLTTQDWFILSQINGRRTLGQIINKCGNELGAQKILLNLLKNRLVTQVPKMDLLSTICPMHLTSHMSGSDRPYPPRLRTNLLLKEIDGKKSLQALCTQLNIKVRDLLEDIGLLLDSQWIVFPSAEQLADFHRLCEEF